MNYRQRGGFYSPSMRSPRPPREHNPAFSPRSPREHNPGFSPRPPREHNQAFNGPQDIFTLCQTLQLRFPPDGTETYYKVMKIKELAEFEVQRKNFPRACQHYTMALRTVSMFPSEGYYLLECPKILCNRSLMFQRLRNYHEAENDAKECIAQFPQHIKAYWRACQAVKGGPNGTYRGLDYIVKGLPLVLATGVEEDISDFFAELSTLIPKADPNTDVLVPLQTLAWPGANSPMWTKVLRKLGNQSAWEAVSMIVTGNHKGPMNPLEGIGYAWDCSVLNAGSLLKSLPDMFLKAWGIELAIQLLHDGADINEISNKFGKPTMHVALEIALRTGNLELLETVLDMYQDDLDKLNATNNQGQTVLHALILTGNKNEHFTEVLDKLLGYNCDPAKQDKNGKKAVNYLHEHDPAWKKLRTAEKTVDELRVDIEQLKNLGNSALKEGRTHESLQYYSQAVQISKKSRDLFKEAAKLYSNRANVYMSLDKYMDALENALAAVNSDKTWHKGYWWKGKSFCGLGEYKDSFNAYIEGHRVPELSREDKLKFLVEAVLLLKDLQDPDLNECYLQLNDLDTKLWSPELWSPVLVKISKAVEWKCVAYLLFGTNLQPARFGQWVTTASIEKLLTGVAGKASTVDVDAKTIFVYLKQQTAATKCYHWLDAALFAVYIHGNETTLQSFKDNPGDTAFHAVTRFSLTTGRLSMLHEVPPKHLTSGEGEMNSHGDSVFHIITKRRPVPGSKVMCAVTNILLEKGYSAMETDVRQHRPIDYLDKSHGPQVFELFLEQSRTIFNKDAVNKLKEEANEMLLRGEVKEAMTVYSKAIDMLRHIDPVTMTRRERAVLYANRTEGYLRLKMFEEAQRDAIESLSQDPNWYKAHMRLGKCYCKLNQFEDAYNSYIRGYNELDPTVEDKTKVDLLKELCFAARQMRNCNDLKKRLRNNPRAHLWVATAYELITRRDWLSASLAYSLVKGNATYGSQLAVSLRPICDLKQLKNQSWALSLIRFLLDSGADRKSLSCEEGDTYLHAMVRIVLVTDQVDLLTYLLKRYCKGDKGTDQHKLDSGGNTLLHIAAREPMASQKMIHKVIMLLLQFGVDPNIKNNLGKRAVDYLPKTETPSHEPLRMAMYSQENTRRQTPEPAIRVQQRPQADQSEKPKHEPKKAKKCEECEELYVKAMTCFDEDGVNMNTGYEKLVEVMQKPHKTHIHETIVNKCVAAIAETLGRTQTPAIPNFLTTIDCLYYIQVIEKLAQKNNWRQLDTFVRKYRTVQGTEKLKGFATNMTIVPVIRDETLRETEDLKLQIMNNLLNSGASLGGDGGQTAIQAAQKVEHYKVLTELIQRGADTSTLSVRDGDTPIHAALTIVLEKTKALSLLEFMFGKYTEDPDANKHLSPDQLDVNGDSLFHIVAKTKYNTTALKVTEFLCRQKLSARYYNLEEKLPVHYLTKKNDRRLQYMRLAAMVEPSSDTSQAKFAKKKSEPEKEAECEDELNDYRRTEEVIAETVEVKEVVPLRDQRKNTIEDLIKILPDSHVSIFTVDHQSAGTKDDAETGQKAGAKDEEIVKLRETQGVGNITGLIAASGEKIGEEHNNIVTEASAGSKAVAVVGGESSQTDAAAGQKDDMDVERKVEDELQAAGERVEAVPADGQQEVVEQNEAQAEAVAESDSDEDFEEDEDETFDIDVQIFDNLEWEVECTAEFWKTLKDKHVPTELKRRIIRKIQLLASGDWHPVLCKKLTNTVPELRLYEAKFSKGSRILWELAVAFSPRCSETADRRLSQGAGEVDHPVKGGRIYSEIIRVWDIVLDHDRIHRSVERINKSHKRGEQCIIQKKLKGIKSDVTAIPTGARKYPRMYAEEDEHRQEMQRFFPPASANDAEFHILKFYTFSSALVSHVLQNIEGKVDFPFRVTDLEHAIINLSSKAPILLLGRSGTGKTTCCMYRLWSQFHGYWSAANKAGAPLLPRCIEFVHKDAEEKNKNKEKDKDDGEPGSTSEEEAEDDDEMPGAVGGIEEEEDIEPINFDHIHQLFITKNAVLCSEVQKNFRELSHADDLMETHVQHETDVLPNRLQEVGDYSFPMFITSKQLLLLLDASIDPPHFFERKEDGSLKVEVAGWSDTEGPLGVLTLLNEDSDDEDDEEVQGEYDDLVDEAVGVNPVGRRAKTDPRREITYAVFVEEVWPRIRKSNQSYHPSLVWTEIMSFIKGSYEALTMPLGHLKLEEYVKLGRKRAPNFTGDRATIYQLFRKYEHFKRQHQLFDETDLVHSVYTRLATRKSPSLPWVIHQIYVDETQDFTQAELCLLIRLCQNPNDMFLTGDTAQSIMRGISFRFSDLRSLFFHAKKSMHAMGKTSAIEVPKQVYQLTHNYRSHAGILSLASSILELMVEFFPESFDRLQPDQGLFHGPQPILLESCSFSDLAVLLRGNRRKTSHIEFGAHQAIIVVNDATRDAIPEELRLGLVLTIYEAKGLEFDDVLLYNFFKDSQASKEWRVVTEFLDRLAVDHQEMVRSGQQTNESLHAIDADILRQEDRPRPLNFDANEHKVLNSELKHLYTALTRARVNVWIFDEDEDKRKPMFEYFKARKLVKSLTVSEINESSLSETMFAEKSSPEDWCKRGDDFMRHSLYGVAAKCFSMGNDKDKEKIALAHEQALKASRKKDKPVLMREEFLYAAQLYLECDKPRKAAICLQNAREKELSAQLFEKLGEFERSAEMYKRLNRPMASSRCYEQLGKFNKAVEVLSESQNYELAIDTLQRYKMLISDLRRDQRMIPVQLIENRPDEKRYSEEKLCHKAAELFHKNKNETKMLEAVERFTSLELRVSFLKNYKYIEAAANILEKNDKLAEASQLLLCNGKYPKAIDCARRTLKENIIGEALLVSCRVLLRKKSPADEDLKHLKEDLNEATDMFKSCNDRDRLGEAYLMTAKLTKKNDDIREAWQTFDRQQLPHSAGLLEVANLMMQQKLFNITTLTKMSEGIGHMFKVCRVLLHPRSPTDHELERKFHRFYGLTRASADKVEVHPREKPLCLEMIEGHFETKADRKVAQKVFDRESVHEEMTLFLISRTESYLEPLWRELETMRWKFTICKYFRSGTVCPKKPDCHYLHRRQNQEDLKKLFEIDLALVKLEANVLKAEELLRVKCSPSVIDKVTDIYLAEGDRNLSHKFRACKIVWNDLMPCDGHSVLIADVSRDLLEYLVKDSLIQSHFRQFLTESWKYAVMPQKNEKLMSMRAVRETEPFLQYLFGFHLFGLMKPRNQEAVDPKKDLTKLESDLEKEVNQRNKEQIKDRYYTLVTGRYDNKFYLECIAHRFFDAYDLLNATQADPYEAIFKFNKFVFLVDKKRDVTFFPEFKTYLMWLEFFITVAFLLVAKMKSEKFPGFVFILPSHYLALLQFVAASFSKTPRLTILQIVEFWKARHTESALTKLQERLTYFVQAVSGERQGVKIINEVVKQSKGDPDLMFVVERVIMLDLLLLCNIGKVVPVQSEPDLLHSVSNIELTEEFPSRLQYAIYQVGSANGVSDVAHALKVLLDSRQRDENLLVCKWVGGKKGIDKMELKDMSLFSDTFLCPRTKTGKSQGMFSQGITVDLTGSELFDSSLTEEEIERGRSDKAKHAMEMQRNAAAAVITRFIKRIASRNKKQGSKMSSLGGNLRQNGENLFEAVRMDEYMCGWCGINFNEKLAEKLELSDNIVIGGKSVLNEPDFVTSPEKDFSASNVWGRPSLSRTNSVASPETNLSEGSLWGKKTEDSGRRQEMKARLLEEIRANHKDTNEHQQKCKEFETFKEMYTGAVAQAVKTVQEFLNHPEFRIPDKEFCKKNYPHHEIEIDRMSSKSSQIEQNVQKQLSMKDWSIGRMQQDLAELETDFKLVNQYVIEVQKKLKEEEEAARQKQAQAASTLLSQPETGYWDDDEMDIETVVEEPRSKPREFRNKNRRRGPRFQHH